MRLVRRAILHVLDASGPLTVEDEPRRVRAGLQEFVLALQIFHEYLGVRWKVLHDAERAYLDEFVNWALAGAASGGPVQK